MFWNSPKLIPGTDYKQQCKKTKSSPQAPRAPKSHLCWYLICKLPEAINILHSQGSCLRPYPFTRFSKTSGSTEQLLGFSTRSQMVPHGPALQGDAKGWCDIGNLNLLCRDIFLRLRHGTGEVLRDTSPMRWPCPCYFAWCNLAACKALSLSSFIEPGVGGKVIESFYAAVAFPNVPLWLTALHSLSHYGTCR